MIVFYFIYFFFFLTNINGYVHVKLCQTSLPTCSHVSALHLRGCEAVVKQTKPHFAHFANLCHFCVCTRAKLCNTMPPRISDANCSATCSPRARVQSMQEANRRLRLRTNAYLTSSANGPLTATTAVKPAKNVDATLR